MQDGPSESDKRETHTPEPSVVVEHLRKSIATLKSKLVELSGKYEEKLQELDRIAEMVPDDASAEVTEDMRLTRRGIAETAKIGVRKKFESDTKIVQAKLFLIEEQLRKHLH